MNRSCKPSSRSGTLVICVLVCLLVASSMVVSTTRSALQARRECRVQQQLRQTELLLEAGVRRAAAQLNDNREYEGEEWEASPISGLAPVVRIKVTSNADSSNEIEVIATLGVRDDGGRYRESTKTQRSHRFRVRTSNPNSPNDSSDSSSSAE